MIETAMSSTSQPGHRTTQLSYKPPYVAGDGGLVGLLRALVRLSKALKRPVMDH